MDTCLSLGSLCSYGKVPFPMNRGLARTCAVVLGAVAWCCAAVHVQTRTRQVSLSFSLSLSLSLSLDRCVPLIAAWTCAFCSGFKVDMLFEVFGSEDCESEQSRVSSA